MLRILRGPTARITRPYIHAFARSRPLTYLTMPVPFTKLRDEAELAVLSVLRGCYL